MAGTPLSAKNAKVRINGTVLYAANWEVNPETTLLPTNHFEGNGYETDVAGLAKCEVTVSGWWDGAANMHDSPLGIVDGAALTNIKLYINDTAGPFWDFPNANVRGVPVTADVAEKINYRFTFKANGQFNYPSGNAA